MSVLLGYEIGSGKSVEIPVKHMCVCGQSQEAGKTTTLEALITRSGIRAVTFITKRGEASFTDARRISPYFREQTDWQFVASILEASRNEKLKFERAWIIRASKGARTLADVQRNVRKAMETAKGMSADVYLTLDAYLDAVVPAIAAVRWAPTLELAAGVNAVDLTHVPMELQHLVIKSSLDWVLEHAEDTIVVIPEAWKFIPEGRGTPVKRAAIALIRQGAGLRNYVWIDSQDLGGVDKETLRSVPVWILGVQREANEIKRTLANIPAGIAKPTAAAIATLGLGQFFACWKTHAVKTYVQPNWLNDHTARAIATGSLPVESYRPGGLSRRKAVTHEEAAHLTRENEDLRKENSELKRRLDAVEARQHDGRPQELKHEPLADPPRRKGTTPLHGRPLDEDGAIEFTRTKPSTSPAPRTFTAEESFDNDRLYHAFKARLIAEAPNEPSLLRVFAERQELLVNVQRRTIETSGDTLRGRLALMISEGFFDEPRTGNTAYNELQRRGFPTAKPNVYREADKLATDGFLTKESDGYKAVSGMKVNIVEAA